MGFPVIFPLNQSNESWVMMLCMSATKDRIRGNFAIPFLVGSHFSFKADAGNYRSELYRYTKWFGSGQNCRFVSSPVLEQGVDYFNGSGWSCKTAEGAAATACLEGIGGTFIGSNMTPGTPESLGENTTFSSNIGIHQQKPFFFFRNGDLTNQILW